MYTHLYCSFCKTNAYFDGQEQCNDCLMELKYEEKDEILPIHKRIYDYVKSIMIKGNCLK